MDKNKIQKIFRNHTLSDAQSEWVSWFIEYMGHEPIYTEEVNCDNDFVDFVQRNYDHITEGAGDMVRALSRKYNELFPY